VKGLPASALDRIKRRATLPVATEVEEGTSPRPQGGAYFQIAKTPCGYTKKIRTTRNPSTV
jgi:hypothetical protein